MARIDFDRAVVERSHLLPVLVDFWAAWCGPCRSLGPLLERLAERDAGRYELVKLDIDAEPEIAEAHDIRGIPVVKLFYRGEVVAEFVGARPEEWIERWLATNLPDPRRERLEQILNDWPSGDPVAVERELERFVADHPDLASGRLRLAQVVVGRDPARARELVTVAEADPELVEAVAHVRTLVELVETRDGVPQRLARHLAGAREALATSAIDRVLGHLVDAAIADRHFGDELARRSAVALFGLLGHHHPLTLEYQRRLGLALH